MRFRFKDKQNGFTAIEGVLIIVVVAAVIGVGFYISNKKNTTAENSLNTTVASTPSATNQAPVLNGTSQSVSQITSQDAATEVGVDSSADGQIQQNAASANGAASNIGGVYNENSL